MHASLDTSSCVFFFQQKIALSHCSDDFRKLLAACEIVYYVLCYDMRVIVSRSRVY